MPCFYADKRRESMLVLAPGEFDGDQLVETSDDVEIFISTPPTKPLFETAVLVSRRRLHASVRPFLFKNPFCSSRVHASELIDILEATHVKEHIGLVGGRS